MSPHKCSVTGCLSDASRKEDEGVTFHRLPSQREAREKWMSLCRIEAIGPIKRYLYACSRHFLRADFCTSKGKKYVLLPGAEPSIFSWLRKKPSLSQQVSVEVTEVEAATKEAEETKVIETIDAEEKMDVGDEPSKEAPSVEVKREPEVTTGSTSSLDINATEEGVKTEIMSSVATLDQKPKSSITPTGTIIFVPDSKIEALDCQQMWSPATIIEIDFEENEVLVHFDQFSSKYDEWLSMSSTTIRAPKTTNEYEVGERCQACWSDFRKFPARVINIIDKDTCEVEFDDGYRKVLKTRRMTKERPVTSTPPSRHSPLFDPVRGTKQERRDKKRRINVTELFGKRSRVSGGGGGGGSGGQDEGGSEVVKASPGTVTTTTTVVIPGLKPGMTGKEDWIIKWNGGKPIGEDSTLEFEDGPKNTIKVADSRLPEKWEKHFSKRPTTGKWEILIVNPEGVKFRTLKEIRTHYIDLNELPKPLNRFDFTHMRPLQKSNKSRTPGQKRPSNAGVATVDTPAEPESNEPPPEPESESPDRRPSTPLLKILQIDNAYRCPIDGCGKNFRRENLAQMHVKHYHPDQFKLLATRTTPNVADLAYARTTVNESSSSVDAARAARGKVGGGGVAGARGAASPTAVGGGGAMAAVNRQKDAEIIRLLMNKHPTDCEQSASSQPQDIRLRDLLNSSSSANVASTGLPGSAESRAGPGPGPGPGRPPGGASGGIRTLLPVVRDDLIIDGDSAKRGRPSNKRKRERESMDGSGGWSGGRGSYVPDFAEESQSSQEFLAHLHDQQSPPGITAPSDIIIEGGQLIRIVRMKREEIINCACRYAEEDGLMIQCEVCLCWQHATCYNIYTETQVPDNYVCSICRDPSRLRPSRKWYYDQEWLKHGRLPTGKYRSVDAHAQDRRTDQLRRTHDLTGALLELREFVRTLKLKIKISENKNHPKLYLWSKPWPKDPLPEKSKPPSTDSMLFNLLKTAKDQQQQAQHSNSHREMTVPPQQPQPEAAIENVDCRLNLLEHIGHCQSLVEERLEDFARLIDDIDDNSGLYAMENETENNRMRDTMQMLMRDLATLKDLSQVTSF